MTEVVLIDIDVKYKYMEEYHLFDILEEKIDFCSKLLGVEVKSVVFRKSQCGNVHLHLIVSDFRNKEDMIRFKFCIGEDHKRLNFSIYIY